MNRLHDRARFIGRNRKQGQVYRAYAWTKLTKYRTISRIAREVEALPPSLSVHHKTTPEGPAGIP